MDSVNRPIIPNSGRGGSQINSQFIRRTTELPSLRDLIAICELLESAQDLDRSNVATLMGGDEHECEKT